MFFVCVYFVLGLHSSHSIQMCTLSIMLLLLLLCSLTKGQWCRFRRVFVVCFFLCSSNLHSFTFYLELHWSTRCQIYFYSCAYFMPFFPFICALIYLLDCCLCAVSDNALDLWCLSSSLTIILYWIEKIHLRNLCLCFVFQFRPLHVLVNPLIFFPLETRTINILQFTKCSIVGWLSWWMSVTHIYIQISIEIWVDSRTQQQQ